MFEIEHDLELVATAHDHDAALAAVEAHEPDVVLTDIRMPPTQTDEGIRVARELRRSRPGVGVVVFSQYLEPDYALALFESGSEGRAYLLKERIGDVSELVQAIRTVDRGGSVIDPKVVDALLAARVRATGSPLDRLTDREMDVLAEIAKGKNNPAIAETLYLSEGAVEKHIGSIFSKLGLTEEERVHRRVRAVLLYLGQWAPESGWR